MQKEDYNKGEKRIAKWVKVTIVLMAMYHIVKIITLMILLHDCQKYEDCNEKRDWFYNRFLLCDSVTLVVCFSYFFYVMASLITQTYRKFRYEYYEHRRFIFVFSVGTMICLPLVLLEILSWY